MTRRAAVAACMLLSALGTAPAADGALEPYKMVRSLQLVQDRLARGDHAAMPMQRKLLEIIDERFRNSTAEDYADARNFNGLLAYAMSGGNPTTLEVVLSRLSLEGDDLTISRGILAYMKGELARAAQLLAPVDPLSEDPDRAAFLALLKGSIMTALQPATALALMDQARLLAPGTLVEEAALRRSLSLCISLGDSECFMRAADRYTRRFLRSPYASEFADSFVEGVITFHDPIGPSRIEEIVGLMNPAQQEAVYLRLARRSTIKGQIERSNFASEKARELTRETEDGEDPRATLYALMSSITSENVAEVTEKLNRIDPAQLSPRDRRLLAAARAIAADVVAPPKPSLAPDPQGAPPAKAAALPQPTGADADHAPGRTPPVADPVLPDEQDDGGAGAALVENVRAKLEAIDRLLDKESKPR